LPGRTTAVFTGFRSKRTPPTGLGLPALVAKHLAKGINVTIRKIRFRRAGVALLALAASLVFSGVEQAATPTITSFAPATGNIGGSITITGTDFHTTPASSSVKFGGSGGTAATVTAATATSLTVTVPGGQAAISAVYVSNAYGSVTGGNFTVNPTP